MMKRSRPQLPRVITVRNKATNCCSYETIHAFISGPSSGTHTVLTRHCRHPRSMGREYPQAATHRASPPACTQCGRKAHAARKGRTREYSVLPPVCRMRRCGARASPLRTPRPHTQVCTCTHTRTPTRTPAHMRAWMHSQASTPAGDAPPSTDRARPMRTALCVLYVWSAGYRGRQRTRNGIVGQGWCRSSLPCPCEGVCT